eukprot:16428838-Heterocapsa_arctica.AAC.1
MSRRTSRRSTGVEDGEGEQPGGEVSGRSFEESSVYRPDLDCSGGREKTVTVDWEKIEDTELKDEGEEKRSMKLVVILRPRAQE